MIKNKILAENVGLAGHGVNDFAYITMHRKTENHEKDLYVLQDELVDFERSDFEEEELSKQKTIKYNNLKRRICKIESITKEVKKRRDKEINIVAK